MTISPGGSQQSFVEGGTARVSAQSDNADISNLQIQYAGDTYSMNEEGTAAIPLVSTGAQELVFQYGDTTEKVAINVDAQASPTTGQADEADGGGDIISIEGPGFRQVHAIIAIFVLVLFSRLYGNR